jgi:hypothetical protein
MARTEAPMAVMKGESMAYVFEREPPWKIMSYPKFRFFLLRLLGAHDFIEETKKKIDAINHLRKKEWLDSAPRRTRGFVSMKWPDPPPIYSGSHTHSGVYEP